jgi:DNA polymerase III epsilon subunit-like protein
MFNKKTADELYESYVNDVLRIPQLLKKVGAPAVELPSGNLYRSAFKFMVEQTGPYHPAREVLNSMIINFNPSRVGMKSINISRSNILTHKTLKRMFEESAQKPSGNIFGSLSAGQKIITFDVETTGVFEGSQVRSMSASMMTVDASGKLVAPDSSQTRNLFMASKQLSGMTVSDTNNGLVSMNKFLAQIENDGKTSIDMADGGKKFLDEAEKFIQELLSADRLVAHNASFDITKMTETIEAQSAFGSHKGVQSALNQLYRKIDKGNYLVDTLGEARSYLQNQVEQIIQSSTATNVIQKSNQYVTSLYSQEILSTVHKGGSAAYASVENIALNTNLFELIENEGKAAELFKDIQKGSHVAKVDTLLQSYIAKYIHEDKLKISQLAQEPINDFGRFARAKIFQSQAITPTTTIADVQHMSDTVFKNVDPKKVTLSISDQLANKYSGKVGPGILSYISQPTDLETTMMPSQKFQGEGYYEWLDLEIKAQ